MGPAPPWGGNPSPPRSRCAADRVDTSISLIEPLDFVGILKVVWAGIRRMTDHIGSTDLLEEGAKRGKRSGAVSPRSLKRAAGERKRDAPPLLRRQRRVGARPHERGGYSSSTAKPKWRWIRSFARPSDERRSKLAPQSTQRARRGRRVGGFGMRSFRCQNIRNAAAGAEWAATSGGMSTTTSPSQP